MVIAILIVLARSALSGLAHATDELTASRAVQGAASRLMVGAIATRAIWCRRASGFRT